MYVDCWDGSEGDKDAPAAATGGEAEPAKQTTTGAAPRVDATSAHPPGTSDSLLGTSEPFVLEATCEGGAKSSSERVLV